MFLARVLLPLATVVGTLVFFGLYGLATLFVSAFFRPVKARRSLAAATRAGLASFTVWILAGHMREALQVPGSFGAFGLALADVGATLLGLQLLSWAAVLWVFFGRQIPEHGF